MGSNSARTLVLHIIIMYNNNYYTCTYISTLTSPMSIDSGLGGVVVMGYSFTGSGTLTTEGFTMCGTVGTYETGLKADCFGFMAACKERMNINKITSPLLTTCLSTILFCMEPNTGLDFTSGTLKKLLVPCLVGLTFSCLIS